MKYFSHSSKITSEIICLSLKFTPKKNIYSMVVYLNNKKLLLKKIYAGNADGEDT